MISAFSLTNLSAQEIKIKAPKNIELTIFKDVDSAVESLDRVIKQQYNDRGTRLYTGITPERLERGNRYYYYESISSVRYKRAHRLWVIIFSSKKTGNADYIRFKDKEMANEAFSALLHLVKASQNK
jgi:hypothetical protein